MTKYLFKSIEKELIDTINAIEAHTRLEVKDIESRAVGYREGVWGALRAFREIVVDEES